MQLPVQIDHRLKDTIISIQFTPLVPSETVVGYVHHLLKGQLKSLPTEQSSWLRFEPTNLTIESRPSVFFLTHDGGFRIDVDGNSITFNSAGIYPGWSAFRDVFQQCVKPLFDNSIIGPLQRLGIRYINRFDQVRIFDHISVSVQIGGSLPSTHRQQVRAEFEQGGFWVVLTLVNGYPVEPTLSKATTSGAELFERPEKVFSLIDVDVIQLFDTNQPNSYENLLSQLEAAHTEEKAIFFSLLKPEFLQSLNPVY